MRTYEQKCACCPVRKGSAYVRTAMSTSPQVHELSLPVDPESQEIQAATEHPDDLTNVQMDTDPDVQEQAQNPKKRKPRGEPQALPCIPGKSVFPVSRVRKILKADRELPMVSREAVLLISLATEEFVRRISEASYRLAARENRATVQRKDIASVCRRADEYFFLEEIIPLYEVEPAVPTKRKPKALQQKEKGQSTLLTTFVSKPGTGSGSAMRVDDREPADEREDVLMNEDGTMTLDSL